MTAQVIFACVHNAGRSQMAAAFFNAGLPHDGDDLRVDAVAGLERADWPIEDPKGKPLDRVRQIRDEVRRRVGRLIEAEGWERKA